MIYGFENTGALIDLELIDRSTHIIEGTLLANLHLALPWNALLQRI